MNDDPEPLKDDEAEQMCAALEDHFHAVDDPLSCLGMMAVDLVRAAYSNDRQEWHWVMDAIAKFQRDCPTGD